MSNMTQYVHRVLERDLGAWLALGWQEHSRDRSPSVEDDIVLIEWCEEGEPVMPKESAA